MCAYHLSKKKSYFGVKCEMFKCLKTHFFIEKFSLSFFIRFLVMCSVRYDCKDQISKEFIILREKVKCHYICKYRAKKNIFYNIFILRINYLCLLNAGSLDS